MHNDIPSPDARPDISEMLFAPAKAFAPYFCARCGAHVTKHNAEEKCQCGDFGAQHVRPA